MDIEDAPFDFAALRKEMLVNDIAGRGISDERVLEALAAVPREYFVTAVDWDEAYADSPLSIACGQTISQPYVVALMSEMLDVSAGMRVLEIGTGSGYQSAVLSAMGAKVFSVERFEVLSRAARDALKKTGLIRNVMLKISDGSVGWVEKAPFDRIILTCCAPEIPKALFEQLSAAGGILVGPVATAEGQYLRKICSSKGEIIETVGSPVRFVPLVGENGYEEGEE